ncbi:uracil-DNA glycosylase [Plasmodium falciparum Santa Lucia]|uniref:Uracil-DNA glycosylase n=14 Tax=Plasmodium falciparum TaxID=5833 RepID=Q8ILU6_PLAF7|nr:uracil-DNA glycosylase [Plasmodium falciparum 3D7]ETW16235.1 uracil-DNA glycosylase [Plasmodium falciparum Vietnam Oak-Knoll (FVO)]ETW27950.1 uracil-DNA glycosylase [Plasmodium falciparum FCH/4]ETW34177.1 uracil-DNA glycosylase [Plasmodium falciparum Tanzania (2000708)]ETW40307.1 uracil-DNA glycosylase [Plasmodium falciparum NF135/5.C10]ETW55332.1 uracil-DNA glycosylase [Plasmodium falciparum Palo Alto/Uganda]ETW58933.1 uracil-DNA glycosylase [Plasmodium falciparum CAMP/Malaysia]EUR64184.|eukprot:XP_001348321.1 uracil-DNA glycosylase [Plasmodium falciparum 3D7]
MNNPTIQKTIDQFFKVKRKSSILSGEIEKKRKKVILEEVEEKSLEGSLKEENVNILKTKKLMNNDEDIEKMGTISNISMSTSTIDNEINNNVKQNVCEQGYMEEIKKLMHIEWYELLKDELKKNYFKNMYLKIKEERKTKVIYPPEQLVFNAFLKTPLSNIKVVIVGQDPYHQKDQAMGLCFSVPIGVKIPPSLKNILKEMKQKSNHGNLISWSEQGVFLLNTSLTVEENKPASHKNYGWETFTDTVINIINRQKEKIIFMLWGNFAIKKCKNIDINKHFILKAGHPSPLSIKHFENCNHFAKCNKILAQHNLTPIKWELPQ